MRLIAHNIRSMHNVGSIFRSADAFGVEKIYLTGYTATPPRMEIAKTALGSEDRVAWEHFEDPLTLIKQLKDEGWMVIALENAKDSRPISEISVDQTKTVLVLGSEVDGIAREILSACDLAVEIPMPGKKRSLNVSAATGIALFALTGEKR
jgi:tRNA G18 (ribose-2'-O)-methylase SpoU